MNIIQLRQQFLEDGLPVFEEVRARTLGKQSSCPAADGKMLIEYWKVLTEMIKQADDPVQVKGLSEGSISDRVDHIMEQVARVH